jgi:DNA-binding response OmpR family regulator
MFDNLPAPSRPGRVLLLDEHASHARAMASELEQLGFRMECASDPEAALRRAVNANGPDLVLLQRRRDGRIGVPFVIRLRTVSPLPCVLRALGADDEWDRIAALEAGADDYATAQMSLRELAARLRRVLNRSGLREEESRPALPTPVEVEELELAEGIRLSVRRREAYTPDEAPCQLTSAEFELLHMLVRAAGQPVSREAMSAAVLRRPHYPEDRALDNLVLRVRRKLGGSGTSEALIKAVRGVGYAFTGLPVRRELEVRAS